MKNPTILMIGNYLPQPKFNKNVWQFLAERLEKVGWQVYTTSSKENKLFRLLDMLRSILRYRNIFDLAEIDVFSGQAFIFAEFCSILLSLLRKPMVLTLHGGGLVDFAEAHPIRVKRLLNCADVIVTPSPYIQHAFSEFRKDIHFIPNPIDLSAAVFRIRKEPLPNLIWIRAFHKIYNPTLAIEVIKLLSPHFPAVRLIMIGPDKNDGTLSNVMTTAKKLSVDTRVKVVGGISHEEIPKWLNQADIFINTTDYDAAPRSVLEAMANGLCVVSTNVGGVPYIIEDGKDGLLVPPDEPELMATAIKKILTDHHLAEMLSKNARLKSVHYDWSSILPQWMTLLKEVSDQDYG